MAEHARPHPVFVIPFFADHPRQCRFLEQTVESLVMQSDPEWEAIVVDDASPMETAPVLAAVREQAGGKVHAVRHAGNRGPGACRNTGTEWAAARGAPFILFQDADDLADPDRLRATRRHFDTRPATDMVYSAFEVVDENGEPVPYGDITPSVAEIVDSHAAGPVEGPDAWIPIATATGYTTLTSTVAVRTTVAVAHPFPSGHASEDTHAWLRMLAGGGELGFLKDVVARYRVARDTEGSASRARMGESFYWRMLQLDLDGFVRAAALSVARGRIGAEEVPELLRRFHLKQAETMAAEGQDDAAETCRSLAHTFMDPARNGEAAP
ncbi:glycosyltransferase family A protein [Streptomonospora sp. PA3]|uniref:glycosyltransferase family 2 protein n=1 Tax=Streptomonospora sp. PA3 TaxID=2607326 RepID=UPI0016430C72|nr:glycosyltransferase family A protein [Streptomonospora sp. PA3]